MVGLARFRNSTSDMVAIFETKKDFGYYRLIGYCFGSDPTEANLAAYANYIEEWENGIHTDLQHSLDDDDE